MQEFFTTVFGILIALVFIYGVYKFATRSTKPKGGTAKPKPPPKKKK